MQFDRKKVAQINFNWAKHRSSLLWCRKVLGFKGFTQLHSTSLATSVLHALQFTFINSTNINITITISVLSIIGRTYVFQITD